MREFSVAGMDTKEAEAYMMQKRLRKTYLEDVWTWNLKKKLLRTVDSDQIQLVQGSH